MRLIEFIKWWWATNDIDSRAFLLFIVGAVVPAFSVSVVVSVEIGLMVLLVNVIGMFAIWALQATFNWLKNEWEDFNHAMPPDDIRIMRRLRGEE